MCLPLLRILTVLLAAFACGGCATISGTARQAVIIQTVDAQGMPVDGMACRVSNGGDADYHGDSPLFDLNVRRSSLPLVVECRANGRPMARAVLVPRADAMQPAQLLLPGGSSLMMIDHVTGFMYAYPRWVRVQVGTDMVFDRRDERGRDPTPGLITRQFDDFVRFASGGASIRAD